MAILNKIKNSLGKRKIKIVAIAKDEAPYFSQWAFHHLYFGFDAISIYINRTTDKSSEILDKICQVDPRVQWHSADWVDYLGDHVRSHLQSIIYAKAYQDAVDEGFTHVFFIDIDEFWIPSDFKSSIHTFLSGFHPQSSLSFQWLCEHGGGGPPFGVFNQVLSGVSTNQVKTLVNTSTGIRRIGIHIPIFENGSKHFFADGNRFVRAKAANQQSDPAYLGLKKAFVLHRLYRSEMEYVVSLTRGRPSEVNSWKNNRAGYITSHPNSEAITLPEKHYIKYNKQYKNWLADSGLCSLEALARKHILNKFDKAVDILSGPEGEQLKNSKMLNGVDLDRAIQEAQQSR
ncbi:MAG: glycosyltransferase family 92 protein [Pseudoalteromonas sp.]|jgi:hypothetical protein|nr:glycosyltransferase family 92 protein [Pseudoalteromonas sp.]